jgi:polysaccharide chain length determinant protein (PEP-CTERM system associated)
MIQNRELTIDDYVSMLRRRLWVILVPALLAPAVGFAISYFFAPKYTSSSTVLVEGPKVPGDYVKPVVTEDVMQRIASLQQQVLSRNRLAPVIQRLGLVKSAENVDSEVETIRQNLEILPLAPILKRKAGTQSWEVPGFNVNLTYSNPRQARQICVELTSMLLEENLKSRENVAVGTTQFLSRQLEEAKHDLDEQDAKLAAFKRQYVGQLPEDADNNLKILMGLNSQLDANTQTINRAQQDKSYSESVLAQQLAAWKAAQSSTSPQALEQQLANLQSQLMQLQAKYTPDHPDVVKTKADVAQVQKKLAEINSAKPETTTQKANAAEPPEIRQLRVQIHQYEDALNQGSQAQKRIQQQIKVYEGRIALSPAVEEQYKRLTRDYDTAQKFYADLLGKKSESEMATDMERQQEGEQFHLLNAASLPSAPSFPNRLLFAAGGLGAGLVLGLGLAMWMELQDKAIRTEQDAEAVMELPMLISLPWVGEMEFGPNGRKKSSSSELDSHKETVQV